MRIPFLEKQGFKTILSKVRSEFGIDAPMPATPDSQTAPGDGASELVQDEVGRRARKGKLGE